MSHKRYITPGEEERDLLCDNNWSSRSSSPGFIIDLLSLPIGQPVSAESLFEAYVAAFAENWALMLHIRASKETLTEYKHVGNEESGSLLNRAFDTLFGLVVER